MQDCSFCDVNRAKFVCGDCREAVYCSQQCQIKAWTASHSITCLIGAAAGSCAIATANEDVVLKFMTPNCPDKFSITPERLAALKSVTEKSKLFSDAFKQTVYVRIDDFFKNLPVSIYVEKNAAPTAKESKSVLVSLTSTNKTTRDVRIKVKGACKKLLMLKSTETCRNDVDIRLRVIDLNNLQKYGDDKYVEKVRATCNYDKLVPPTVFNEVGTCKKTFSFVEKPRYVVLVHHHFFDKNGSDRFSKETLDPKPFVPYGISPELSTTEGLMAKVQFYSDKDVKRDPAKETVYQLTLYYQNSSGAETKRISGPEDVPFEYNVHTGVMQTLGKK